MCLLWNVQDSGVWLRLGLEFSEGQGRVRTSRRRLGRYIEFGDFQLVELTWINVDFFFIYL